MGAGSHNRLLFARQDERSKRFWPLEIYPLAFLLYAESHSRANLFFAMGKFLRKMPIMHINQHQGQRQLSSRPQWKQQLGRAFGSPASLR